MSNKGTEETMKAKLVELIANAPKLEASFMSRAQGKTYQTVSNIADYLLANGVVVIDADAVSLENRPLISTYMERPLDKIVSLIRAEEEGRLIELPWKVGDDIYCLFGNSIIKLRVAQIAIPYIKEIGWSAICLGGWTVERKDWGVTAFSSEEEAKKALAKMNGGAG